MQAGQNYFSFAVSESGAGNLSQLVLFSINSETGPFEIQDCIRQIPGAPSFYHKIEIGFDFGCNLVAPLRNYSWEEMEHLLSSVPGFGVISSDPIPDWQLMNIYRVPASVRDILLSAYPKAQICHVVTTGLMNLQASPPEGMMELNFDLTFFSVLAGRSGRLLITSRYEYSAPEDVLYQLLRICREFSLQQEQVQIHLTGFIDQQSALFRELCLYFSHISFRDAGWSTGQRDYPPHFFTTLNDLARCASSAAL